MTEQEKALPQYVGMKFHADPNGFGFWLPSDWHQFDLKNGHKGVLYSPYTDDINTGLLGEKRRLKVKINHSDLPTLREAFMQGIRDLPGVEIEMENESLSKTLSFFEVRFTFLDGEIRRKRWVRNIYWGKNNYILIAQGRTVEEFNHWLPMFFNIMMNAQV